MRERIKLVKGEFLIDSQIKGGTTVHAKVPTLRWT
jgi:signal transduction histidine kinase